MSSGAALAREWFANSPFVRELGMQLVDISPDAARVEVTDAEDRLVAEALVTYRLG